MNEFEERIHDTSGGELRCRGIEIMQLNLGLRCNQECAHCHVGASPRRTEAMDWATMELALDACRSVGCSLVDLTGGAPELNPHFQKFVAALCGNGHRVQTRTNLTVLLDPRMDTLPGFLREHNVQIVASMPCYLGENVRRQRGRGVYEKSIEAMRRLNAVGYGVEEKLSLDLVYNPAGPLLPPDQKELEEAYREELGKQFGIHFSKLLTITNMPIGRFLRELRSQDQETAYDQLLRDAFNPDTLDKLMCRRQVTVGWDGRLYDCDFNLALELSVDHGVPEHIGRFDGGALAGRRIVTGAHCFGCTAGSGSSCGGALV